MGVRLSLPAPMDEEYELTPLFWAMFHPLLAQRYPNLSAAKRGNKITVKRNNVTVLAIEVVEDYLLVSREVPRYETHPRKIRAADPNYIDQVFEVLTN
jgi:hypothetical protein